MKTARNVLNIEFWWCYDSRVPGVNGLQNRPRTPKRCAIAHENGWKCQKQRFSRYPNICVRGSQTFKIGPRPQNNMLYATKTTRNPQNDEFWRRHKFVYLGHIPSKSSPDPKTVCCNPQKRAEMPETTSFDDVQMFVYRGSLTYKIIPGL